MAPRLRKDLVATTADEQGVACVEVTDPGSGTSFRFYDFEYALAQELNGQPVEAVVGWARETYGIELSADALEQFLDKLAGLGFLEGGTSGAQPAILAPFSPSSGSQPFGDLPTTVAVDGPPLHGESAAWAPAAKSSGAMAAGTAAPGSLADAAGSGGPAVDAAAPQGLISGDATEYGLRDAGSGLWERPDAVAGSSPQEPLALLPKLQLLADPLPPVSAVEHSPDTATPIVAMSPAATQEAPPRTTAVAPPASVTFPMASDMPRRNSPPAGLSIPVRWPPPDLSALGPLDAPAPYPAPRAPTRGAAAGLGAGDRPGGDDTPLTAVAQAIAASIAPPPSEEDDAAMEGGAAGAEDEERGGVGEVGFSSLATTHLRRPEGSGIAGIPGVTGATASHSPVTSSETAPSMPPSPRVDAAQAVPLPRPAESSSSPVRSPSSWARELVKEVDRVPGGEASSRGPELDTRRQAPQPIDVVVIPPVAGSSPGAAASPGGAPASGTRRGRSYALPVMLLLVAAGSGAVWFFRFQQADDGPAVAISSAETAPQVHVVSPQPTTFYRWFETAGAVAPGQDETLAFAGGGRVFDVMPPGTTFAAGETIGRLFGVGDRELAVNRLRSRVAYYEQLRDSSRAEGSSTAAQQAEAKLASRRQELAAAQAALAALEIRPRVPGVIAEAFVSKGAVIKPGTPALRVRSAGPRALFPLSAEEAKRARALTFCRVETVPGTGGGGATGSAAESAVRAIDCAVSPPAGAGTGAESRLAVDLVGAPAVTPGTQVRLASARYDGVFPAPRAAVVREGGIDHVWIVSGGGRFAERRTVEVVGTVDDLALIGHGVAVGDAVIVDPPVTLKGGAEINVAR